MFDWIGDYWASRWFIFIAAAFILYVWKSPFRVSLKIFLCYLFINTFRNFAYPFGMQIIVKDIALSFHTAWTALILFSFVYFAKNMNKIVNFPKILTVFNVFFVFWCFLTIFFTPWLAENLANRSANASTISMMLPFCFNIPNLILALFAILSTDATMGLLSLCVSASFYLVLKHGKMRYLFIAPVLCTVGWFACDDNFTSFSGRIEHWRLAFEFFQNKASALFGFGNGTFNYLFPMIQEMKGLKTHNYFVFLHNDYIQLLFENGWIGIILALVTFSDYMIYLLLNKKYIMAMFACSYACNMFGNFPNHVSEQAILVCLALSLLSAKGAKVDRSPFKSKRQN